jgi:hypothetical protein
MPTQSEDLELLVALRTDGPRTICITLPPQAVAKVENPRRICITLPRRTRLIVPLSFPGGSDFIGDLRMTTMTVVQQVQAGPVSAVDAKGNPAPLDGAPLWTSSDETILLVTAEADGLNAVIKAAGKVGTAQVRVDADADLGAGVTTISSLLDFEILPAQAVGLSINVGTPTDQPPVEPPVEPPVDQPRPDQTLPGDLPGGSRRGNR